MIALRLSLLGWTQEEIASKVGGTRDEVRTLLGKISEMKKSPKEKLGEGHPHLDVAERQWSNPPWQKVILTLCQTLPNASGATIIVRYAKLAPGSLCRRAPVKVNFFFVCHPSYLAFL